MEIKMSGLCTDILKSEHARGTWGKKKLEKCMARGQGHVESLGWEIQSRNGLLKKQKGIMMKPGNPTEKLETLQKQSRLGTIQ